MSGFVITCLNPSLAVPRVYREFPMLCISSSASILRFQIRSSRLIGVYIMCPAVNYLFIFASSESRESSNEDHVPLCPYWVLGRLLASSINHPAIPTRSPFCRIKETCIIAPDASCHSILLRGRADVTGGRLGRVLSRGVFWG